MEGHQLILMMVVGRMIQYLAMVQGIPEEVAWIEELRASCGPINHKQPLIEKLFTHRRM
jgi:hypothetical protein